MTALDQAFIKAFAPPGSAPAAAAAESARPAVPLSQALASLATASAPKVSIDSLLSDGPRTAAVFAVAKMPVAQAASDESPPPAPKTAAAAPRTEPIAVFDAHAALTSPAVEAAQSPAESQSQTAMPGLSPEPAAVAAEPWQPMLQVDNLRWPTSIERLEASGRHMDTLTESLTAMLRSGRKVLGFGSCTTGEGVTTLLIAAARRMSAQGLTAALVDASAARPNLAQMLGLSPQIGWEEALCGQTPLAEVAVESLAEHLTIIPMRRTDELKDATAVVPRAVADLGSLAPHYDAVLVDLGVIDGTAPGNPPLGPALARHVDALLVVQSVRSTTPDRIDDLRHDLAASGASVAGIIQNFVAG